MKKKNLPQPPHALQNKDRRFLLTLQEEFSGPLPHPRILEQYEKILPRSTNRIIKMAESQMGHRQKIEKAVIKSNILNEKRGMYFAFILTLIFMILGFILVSSGKTIEGFLTMFGPGAVNLINFGIKKYQEIKEPKRSEKEIEKKG